MGHAEALDAVRAVYGELGQRPLERACVRKTECCQFRLTGKTPYLTRAEALLVAEALQRQGIHRLPEKKDGSCPLLREGDGACSVYADRPFSCRTHFCAAAGGPYARKEVQDLIWRLEDLDTRLGGVGAQTLPAAVREALIHVRALGKARGVAIKAAPRSRGR
jgi:Fe-S-cluster containining protein